MLFCKWRIFIVAKSKFFVSNCMLLKNNRFLLLAVTVLESIHEVEVLAWGSYHATCASCQTLPHTYWIAHEFDILKECAWHEKILSYISMYHEMFFLQAELAREARNKVLSHWMGPAIGTKKIRYHFSHLSRNLVSVSWIQCKSFFHPSPLCKSIKSVGLKVVY